MHTSKEFLHTLTESELAFFYTFRLPTLSTEQQPALKEYILNKISANQIQVEISRPVLPTFNKCRRCNSDKIETLSQGVNIDGPRTCAVCLKVQSKSALKRGVIFLFDLITQGNS